MTEKRIDWTSNKLTKQLRRRQRGEQWFKALGISAVVFAASMLVILLGTILTSAFDGFRHSEAQIEIPLTDPQLIPASTGTREERADALEMIGMRLLLLEGLKRELPDLKSRREQRRLLGVLSIGAQDKLRRQILKSPDKIGQSITLWLPVSDDIDQAIKGNIDLNVDENDRKVTDIERTWITNLTSSDRLRTRFQFSFFTNGDSSEPELAGIYGAIIGSLLTLFVTLVTSLPLGLLSATYLEEFANRSTLTNFIEVNINNLAAVPSVIYGLLGLYVFLGVMNLPRSSPLVGGLTLALMTLPTIIIASRSAIRAVPDDIRLGAMALGASRMQVVFHHVIPMAMPGIMTGTIIGMSRALGETAPLLMIGMVAFIVSAPDSLTDPSTVLPVQIFLWSKGPERAFIEKTSAAILVLVVFLILMNALAIWLRQRFDKRIDT